MVKSGLNQKLCGFFKVSGYIGGQLVDALLVGAETFALMLLLRLAYAPLIAVMVGATNIVPVLGPFLGAVPGVLLLLLESPLQAAEFLIIILAVQQIDGAIRTGGAAGHRGGRRAVWHPRHGSRCAHAGRFGSAGTAGGGRRADGPRPARGTTARPAGKNCYKKGKKLTICLLHHAPICKYNKINKPNGQ